MIGMNDIEKQLAFMLEKMYKGTKIKEVRVKEGCHLNEFYVKAFITDGHYYEADLKWILEHHFGYKD